VTNLLGLFLEQFLGLLGVLFGLLAVLLSSLFA
jgi:hypothetical protein